MSNFNNFTFKINILKGQTNFTNVKVFDKPCILMLSKNDEITYKIKLPSTLTAPVSKNDILGFAKLYVNNKLYRQTPLKSSISATSQPKIKFLSHQKSTHKFKIFLIYKHFHR